MRVVTYYSNNRSEEEIARDWTLSPEDIQQVQKFRKNARLYIAIQICCIRLYGRFVLRVEDLTDSIVHYLNKQLNFPTQLTPDISTRKATYTNYHKVVLNYLGFQKFGSAIEKELRAWLGQKVKQGQLPDELFVDAQQYLLAGKILH